MIDIRPVSDLRYKFTEIESVVREGRPVYLTKNGYGSMVVMSIDAYSRLVDNTEDALDEMHMNKYICTNVLQLAITAKITSNKILSTE